jgi:tripartite-type tricarboxylate transporter receptor subunit TctC
LLTQQTGTDAVHVPYRSSGQLVTDILAGQLPMSFDNFSSVFPHAREGRMRMLAVGSAQRWPAVPDMPTVAETLPGFESLSWHGLFAPASMPRPAVERLTRETVAALQSPDVVGRFSDVGIAPGTLSGDAFRDFVAAETRRWGEVARRANIRAE